MNGREQLFASIAKGSRVRNLDLRGAELAGADLSNLSADELNLGAADMSLATMRGSRFRNCRFERVKLEKADWSGATLRMCVFDGAQAVGARFDGATLEDSSATSVDFTGTTLRHTKLTETSFERALLRGAVLDDAGGEGIEFRGADLSQASMVGARFDEADFRGANLQGADLSRGRFHSADFRGAILEGTRFDGADCAGARFDEGAGPHASTAASEDRKDSTSFEQLASAALRQGLDALPGVLATREGAAAEFLDRIQQGLGALGTTADHSPEEWKQWLNTLTDKTKDEGSSDLNALLAALGEAPPALRNAFAAGTAPTAQMTEHLQRLVTALDGNPDQPPGEWKPWLEPLMKLTKEGRALDLNAVFDALAALTRGQQPTATQVAAPPAKEPGDPRG